MKRIIIEPGPGIRQGLRDLPKNINSRTIGGTLLALGFALPGMLRMATICAGAGLTEKEMVSWLFSIWFFGGLIGVVMSLRYKMPIAGAYSIPGSIMLVSVFQSFTFQQAIAGYFLAGVIVLIIGLTGSMSKLLRVLPMPIVSAMIVGMLFQYLTGIITGVTSSMPLVAIPVVLAFFLTMRFSKKIPPIVAALVVGIIMVFVTGAITPSDVQLSFVTPRLYAPSFENFGGILLSIAVPLAILVMGAENTQAIGVLKNEGYDPPVNAMTVISGIGGILVAPFGGHNANIAGPMTAMCATDVSGPKEGRYAATTMLGLVWMVVAFITSIAVTFVSSIPSAMLNLIVGLSIMSLMTSSLKNAFAGGKFKFGALIALATGISGISLFNISASFWALIFGTITSLIVETKDFKEMMAEKEKAEKA